MISRGIVPEWTHVLEEPKFIQRRSFLVDSGDEVSSVQSRGRRSFSRRPLSKGMPMWHLECFLSFYAGG